MNKMKVFVPVDVEEAAKNGYSLIATHSVNVTDDKVKLGLVQQHLKEQELYCFTKEQLEKLVIEHYVKGVEFTINGLGIGSMIPYKNIDFSKEANKYINSLKL